MTVRYSAGYLFCWLSGRLSKIAESVCIAKSQKILCVSFSKTGFGSCIYHLFVWSNVSFLHNSQWITLPTQSCLVLYSLYADLLRSFIMWLIVTSLSQHNLHLLLYCILFGMYSWVFRIFTIFARQSWKEKKKQNRESNSFRWIPFAGCSSFLQTLPPIIKTAKRFREPGVPNCICSLYKKLKCTSCQKRYFSALGLKIDRIPAIWG